MLRFFFVTDATVATLRACMSNSALAVDGINSAASRDDSSSVSAAPELETTSASASDCAPASDSGLGSDSAPSSNQLLPLPRSAPHSAQTPPLPD